MFYDSFYREQFDTIQILVKAQQEGRLFARINWPRDPEIVCNFIKNYILLYMCVSVCVILIIIYADRANQTTTFASHCKRLFS